MSWTLQFLIWFCFLGVQSVHSSAIPRFELLRTPNVTNCEYEGHFPEYFVPWIALIKSLPRSRQVAAIISETILLTKGESFRDKKNQFALLPFANYTVQIGVPGDRTNQQRPIQIQNLNISFVKPHPALTNTYLKWPQQSHNLVLIYLKEPIKFVDGLGPICLPNATFINRLQKSSNATIEGLNSLLIHGTNKTTSHKQISYYIKLEDKDVCQSRWQANPTTSKFSYSLRVCGNITQPSADTSCIIRDSGAALSENGKWTFVGFQNSHFSHWEEDVRCNQSMTIFVSLLMPDDLAWIHNDVKCGHLRFSCDNGTKCLDLKTVCDGKTHQCRDKSDQSSFLCNALHSCDHSSQFTCSTGLAAYCIPAVNPKTGKVAKNCDGVNDCPNGEDEDAVLCASNFPMIWVYIGIGVVSLLISSLIIAIGVSRSRNRRDLTEEELVDFFEGERHLQIDQEVDFGANESPSHCENDGVINDDDDGVAPLIQPSLESTGLEFCPEIVRRRGYDKSLDFDIRNPSHCTLGPQIGEGTFGIVKKGFVHGKPAAIKFPVSIEVTAFKVLLLELKILKYLHDAGGDTGHPNIVRFLGADTQLIRKRILYLALEFCENGNIQHFIGFNRAHFQADICGHSAMHLRINPNTPRYSSVVTRELSIPSPYPIHSECIQKLIRWAAQIASGMKFLSHKIIHLDLATRNVLLDSNLVAKVGDFGLSRKVYENINYKIKRKDPLPFPWLALEILTIQKCSSSSDVWSYGVTLWELFSLCEDPWQEVSDCHVLKKMLMNGHRLPPPKYASPEIYDRMFTCWNEKPESRPKFGELEAFFESLLRPESQVTMRE